METTKPGTQRRHPPELRERAVRMVEEISAREGNRHGVLTRVATQLGINAEALRKWVRAAGGGRPQPGAEEQRVLALEREIRELRRANEILKVAGAVFAGEIEPRLPR